MHHLEEACTTRRSLGGFLGWLVNTLLSAVVGAVVGALVVFVRHLLPRRAAAGGSAAAH